MHEPVTTLFGIKSTALTPAIAGALVYAMRRGESRWYWRITSALAGTISAIYLGEAIVLHLGIKSIEFYNASIFLMGLLGVSLTEALIGIASDPKFIMNILKTRMQK